MSRDLHDGDGPVGDAGPVEGPDTDPASDHGTQTTNQLVDGVQQFHDGGRVWEADDVICSTLRARNTGIAVALLFLVHPSLDTDLGKMLRVISFLKIKSISILPDEPTW